MTPEQERIARKFFRYEIHTRSGNAFESLFTEIMGCAEPGFKQVKPQGQVGDRKNDGFIQSKGKYYQVYAPENIQDKRAEAVAKAEEDFAGLLAFWDQVSPIKEYYFCFNDRYSGTFPTIEVALARIATDHKISTGSLIAKNLEDILFACGDAAILDIVGGIPNPAEVDVLDFSTLHEVVNHLLGLKLKVFEEPLLEVPDFSHKIKFNGLSADVAKWLELGSIHAGILDDYFDHNAGFHRKDVRNHLASLYSQSKDVIAEDAIDAGDLRFHYILDHAAPGRKLHYVNAVLIVMSYFFEACDIFEPPITNATT